MDHGGNSHQRSKTRTRHQGNEAEQELPPKTVPDRQQAEPPSKENKLLEFGLAGLAFLLEFLALNYGNSILAWGAALLFWFAIRELPRVRQKAENKRRRIHIGAALLLIVGTVLLTSGTSLFRPKTKLTSATSTSPATATITSKPDSSSPPAIDPDELAKRIAKELGKTTVSGKHYAVARDVIMESQTRDNLVFFGAYGDRLYTPIAILLYARITNLQGIESQVTGVAVELSAKGFHHKVRAIPIPTDITFYGQGDDHVVKELRPDSLLLDALRKPIPPHKFAEGWLFLDVSKQYESLPRQHEYAMTVMDASGNKDVISFGTDENVQFATPSFMAVSVLGTLPSDWRLQHWIDYDPWAKFRPPSER